MSTRHITFKPGLSEEVSDPFPLDVNLALIRDRTIAFNIPLFFSIGAISMVMLLVIISKKKKLI